jgi:hypothetical protein
MQCPFATWFALRSGLVVVSLPVVIPLHPPPFTAAVVRIDPDINQAIELNNTIADLLFNSSLISRYVVKNMKILISV